MRKRLTASSPKKVTMHTFKARNPKIVEQVGPLGKAEGDAGEKLIKVVKTVKISEGI